MTDWEMCTSGQAVLAAGENADSTITASGQALLIWYDEAIGDLDTETGKAYIDNFSSLPTGVANTCGKVVACKIAQRIVAYNTTGYLSREADTILNVNDDIITQGIRALKDFTNIKLRSPI